MNNTKKSFIIEGLAGKKSLKGTVYINGAKNSALKAIAASVLFDGPTTLENVPDTDDIHTLINILTKLGAKVGENKISQNGSLTLVIDPTSINSTDMDPDLAKIMRGSVVLTGPMLGRFGKVSFPSPGGCVIGARPIDLFIEGYKKMGAKADEKDCVYDISVDRGLKGAEIFFEKVSVGATETLMMSAVLAKGKTVLRNCAMEPEIVNTAEWLVACGANISGVGTPTITVEGRAGKLLSPTAKYTAIPDRIEAGSFLLLGALCAESLEIRNCRPDHLENVISLLRDSGVPMEIGRDFISIKGNTKPSSTFKSFELRTHEYPGFPTDLQAQAVTYLTQVTGENRVLETIFEGRFKYVADLVKMGATITEMNPHEILVKGPSVLRALSGDEELSAHDIRAGFAVVMAALCASGTSTINNVHLIDRGYVRLEERLQAIGANIQRK